MLDWLENLNWSMTKALNFEKQKEWSEAANQWEVVAEIMASSGQTDEAEQFRQRAQQARSRKLTPLQKTILESLTEKWSIVDATINHQPALELVKLGLAESNTDDPRKFRLKQGEKNEHA